MTPRMLVTVLIAALFVGAALYGIRVLNRPRQTLPGVLSVGAVLAIAVTAATLLAGRTP